MAEPQDLLNFLTEKIATSPPPWVWRDVWKEFQNERGTTESVEELQEIFEDEVVTLIQHSTKLDISDKVKLLIDGKARITRNFQRTLASAGKLSLDTQRRIKSFEVYDETNPPPAKKRRGRQPKVLVEAAARRQSCPEPGNPYAKSYLSKERRSEGASRQTPRRSTGGRFVRSPRHQHASEAHTAEDHQDDFEYPMDPTIGWMNQTRRMNRRAATPYIRNASFDDEMYDVDSRNQLAIRARTSPVEEPEFEYPTEPMVNRRHQLAIAPTPHEENHSVRVLLRNVKIALLGMENPALSELIKQVDTKINQLEGTNNTVPSNAVKTMLEAVFLMITNEEPRYLGYPEDAADLVQWSPMTSVQRNLDLLRFIVITLKSNYFDGFLARIDSKLSELSDRDEIIDFNSVRLALELLTAFLLR